MPFLGGWGREGVRRPFGEAPQGRCLWKVSFMTHRKRVRGGYPLSLSGAKGKKESAAPVLYLRFRGLLMCCNGDPKTDTLSPLTFSLPLLLRIR